MKKVIIGSIAVLIGVASFSASLTSFFTILAGTIPVILIIGGGLTIYLNYGNDSSDSCDEPVCHDIGSGSAPSPDSQESISESSSVETSIQTDARLLGNTETLVFHNSDCNFSTSVNCTATFRTREEAVDQGYKPCGVCKP